MRGAFSPPSPPKKAFRVLNYTFDWSIIISGKYFDWLVSGLVTTLKLSAISIVLAFIPSG